MIQTCDQRTACSRFASLNTSKGYFPARLKCHLTESDGNVLDDLNGGRRTARRSCKSNFVDERLLHPIEKVYYTRWEACLLNGSYKDWEREPDLLGGFQHDGVAACQHGPPGCHAEEVVSGTDLSHYAARLSKSVCKLL